MAAEEKEIVTIHLDFDMSALREIIWESGSLNDNHDLFSKLSEVQILKSEYKDLGDKIATLESDIKQAINGRAKQLYGATWQTIAGDGYKVNRQSTGSVYGIMADVEPGKKFLKIKKEIDKDAVETYMKENSKLPKGIEYNPNRGESIVIRIKAPKVDVEE